MILHAASIAAFFAGQLAQPPVVAHCVVPPNADPGLKQWIQPVLNIVSIVAVVGIAIWSFGATSRKEHRQWVRDQKKAEWKELLIKVAGIEEIIPSITTGLPDYKPLENAVLAILPLLRGNIFIHDALESNGFIGQWESFTQFISGEFEATIRRDNHLQRGLLDVNPTLDILENSGQIRDNAELKVRAQFHDLRNKLRILAQKELRI